jgi:hypothetical protein
LLKLSRQAAAFDGLSYLFVSEEIAAGRDEVSGFETVLIQQGFERLFTVIKDGGQVHGAVDASLSGMPDDNEKSGAASQ